MNRLIVFLCAALLSLGCLADGLTPLGGTHEILQTGQSSMCELIPELCQDAPAPHDCPPGKHWSLAGTGIAHCVSDDMVCGWGFSLIHDVNGNPSCIPNTCPPGKVLQSDGITCATPSAPPPSCPPPAFLQPDGTCEACAPGTYWNGSVCVSTPPPTCPATTVWNGSSCVCPAPTTLWNGAQCVVPPLPECIPPSVILPDGTCGINGTPPTNPPVCPGNSVSDGVNCVCPYPTTIWDPATQTCVGSPPPPPPVCTPPAVLQADGSCAVPSTPPTSCSPPFVLKSDGSCGCPDGENWNGSMCVPAGPPATPPVTCPVGTAWDEISNACMPIAGGCNVNEVLQNGVCVPAPATCTASTTVVGYQCPDFGGIAGNAWYPIFSVVSCPAGPYGAPQVSEILSNYANPVECTGE